MDAKRDADIDPGGQIKYWAQIRNPGAATLAAIFLHLQRVLLKRPTAAGCYAYFSGYRRET